MLKHLRFDIFELLETKLPVQLVNITKMNADYFKDPGLGDNFTEGEKVKKELHIYFQDEESTRIPLSCESRLLIEKKQPTFSWCPRLIFLTSQKQVFPVECCQRATRDWTPCVKDSFCKTSADGLSESSSRYSSKVTSQMRIHCLPMV
ncbi:hypothetical protein TNCV_916121 [Trichonephila clavipes]|nr:hypothetical protein TNCV_916121 [Trichonephila clavipes]